MASNSQGLEPMPILERSAQLNNASSPAWEEIGAGWLFLLTNLNFINPVTLPAHEKTASVSSLALWM